MVPLVSRELKKGSTEILILSVLEDGPHHGYEIGRLIDARSRGILKLNAASLYPILYRMEGRAWIQGSWEARSSGRRRRVYRLTAAGRRVLARERESFRSFVRAVERVARIRHA